ncbi:MAG TPA: tyrosine-type recombinase/integrase [Candidatus Dormibacteraeota bacterium]|nr:tyrosine-type recombinase/integrase [Candidatus Dormibacteraeota bacterium]
MQRGHLYKRHGSWLLKYYDEVVEAGAHKRIRVTAKIGAITDYPSKASIRLVADKHLAAINSKETTPESSQTVADFIESVYFPKAQARLRASTIKGYKDIFKFHVKKRLGDLRLRDFRAVHGQRMLAEIASVAGVSHRTLLHIKSFLSGVFTFAAQQGILDGANPMQPVSVEGRPTRFKGATYSSSELMRMFVRDGDWSGADFTEDGEPLEDDHVAANLPPVARMVIAVAALTGLRASEIRGLRWSDYDGQYLYVKRAVWRTVVAGTKTVESEAPVPVVPILKDALDKFRTSAPSSAYIFGGERKGAPINLHNLARRVIIPRFKAAGIPWKGWHAFRRSVGTLLFELGSEPKLIQGVLRHASVSTTLQIYVLPSDNASREQMKKLSEKFLVDL